MFTEDLEKREEMLAKFQDFQRKSDMYYAYHSIQRYTVSFSKSILPPIQVLTE